MRNNERSPNHSYSGGGINFLTAISLEVSESTVNKFCCYSRIRLIRIARDRIK